MEKLCRWPEKLTREQQRGLKEREQSFRLALKGLARAAGWRFSRGGVFRQSDEWFFCSLPMLCWERGARVELITKPMRLDPLFWEIFGLSENQKLPLSFRANGSFVLRPPAIQHCIASDLTDVEDIADAVLKWANQKYNELLETNSVEQMLVDLTEQNLQRGESITLQICLQILAGDKGAALQTCINARAKQQIHHATEVYVTYSNQGKRVGFCELAQDWLQQRSSTIQPVR